MIDSECNEAPVAMLGNISRDTTAPSLSLDANVPADYCFNNDASSDHYGGTTLDDFIHVTSTLDVGSCNATTGSLVLSHPSLADFVLTSMWRTRQIIRKLWRFGTGCWVIHRLQTRMAIHSHLTSKPPTARAMSSEVQQFSICVDNLIPANSFTHFDAHPAHNGVWLNWSWEMCGANAQRCAFIAVRIRRRYPSYPNDQWNNPAKYDFSTMPPLGWTLVATQSGPYGTVTSATYADQNNRGDVLTTHIEGSKTFWLDAEASWSDGDENSSAYRNVYRYVTFVRDAGGNWSVGDPFQFSRMRIARRIIRWEFSAPPTLLEIHIAGQSGYGRLKSIVCRVFYSYRRSYRNIGPVVIENGGAGKGIPDPDPAGMIDFDDLVPFSFNFGVVSPVGITTEFAGNSARVCLLEARLKVWTMIPVFSFRPMRCFRRLSGVNLQYCST